MQTSYVLIIPNGNTVRKMLLEILKKAKLMSGILTLYCILGIPHSIVSRVASDEIRCEEKT